MSVAFSAAGLSGCVLSGWAGWGGLGTWLGLSPSETTAVMENLGQNETDSVVTHVST